MKCQLALVCSSLPGPDFLDQVLLVGDPAVEALRDQDAEFGFGEIKPTAVLGGVVPFETIDQAAGLDGRKRFIKRGLAVERELRVGG